MPRYLEDLEHLVNIDSGTHDKPGVDEVVAWLEARYLALGARVERSRHAEYGDTLVAELRGDGGGSLLLIGHTDTVYPSGTTADRPFCVESGRALGPGVADMKAGDLSILYALQTLVASGWRSFDRLVVIHNSDEEVGSPSSKSLIRREAERADAVFVLEAGRENGNIVSARKGLVSCMVEVSGVAAHAGVNHHRGRSAVLELARLIVELEELNGTFPDATLNVGRVIAGDRVNVVPSQASAWFEIRAFDTNTLERFLKAAEEVVARRSVPDTQARMTAKWDHFPMERSPASEHLVELARSLATDLGFEVDDTRTGGASDGNTAAAAGRPVLDGLGPVGGNAHSPDEYLVVASIVPRTALLCGLIARVGADGSLVRGTS